MTAAFSSQAATRGGLLRQGLERPVASCPTRLTSSGGGGTPTSRNSDNSSPLLKSRSGASGKASAHATSPSIPACRLQAGMSERTVNRQVSSVSMADRTGSRQVPTRERAVASSGGVADRSMGRQVGGCGGTQERSNSRQAPSRSGSQGTPQDRHVRALSARPGDLACGGAVPASSAAWQSRLGADAAAAPRNPSDWASRLRPTSSIKQAMGARQSQQPQSRLSA